MPIQLADDLKTAINNARADGFPMLVASVDASGQPSMSIRGSLQAIDDSRLGIWIRNQDGGILKSIAVNPHIALWYRNTTTNTAFLMHGEAVKQQVYDASPEGERNMDPERKCTAMVIDLIRVIQRGPVLMER